LRIKKNLYNLYRNDKSLLIRLFISIQYCNSVCLNVGQGTRPTLLKVTPSKVCHQLSWNKKRSVVTQNTKCSDHSLNYNTYTNLCDEHGITYFAKEKRVQSIKNEHQQTRNGYHGYYWITRWMSTALKFFLFDQTRSGSHTFPVRGSLRVIWWSAKHKILSSFSNIPWFL